MMSMIHLARWAARVGVPRVYAHCACAQASSRLVSVYGRSRQISRHIQSMSDKEGPAKRKGTITSAAQRVNKKLLAATSWDELTGILEESEDVVNATNLATAFHKLGKLEEPLFHDYFDQRVVRILKRTLTLLREHPQQFESSHYGVISHSIAQKQLQRSPHGMELLDAIVEQAGENVHNFKNPKHFCLLLWAVSKIEAPLPEIFVKASPYIARTISQFTTYDLSVLAWSYASFHDVLDQRSCKQISIGIAKEAMERKDDFSPKEFALLTWGCTLLGYTPSRFIDSLLQYLESHLQDCSYHDLSLFVVTLGRLGVNLESVDSLRSVTEEIRTRFAFHPSWGWRRSGDETVDTHSTSSTIEKLAWSDTAPPENRMNDETFWPSVEELPRTVAGLQSLARFDSSVNIQPVLEALYHPLSGYRNSFGVEELSSMLHGLSAGRVFAPELFELIRSRLPEVLVQSPSSSIYAQHLSEILWGFAHSGVPATRVFIAASQHIKSMAHLLDFKQATLCLAAMHCSQFWKPETSLTLAKRILEIAPDGVEAVNPDVTQTFGRFALENGEEMYIPKGSVAGDADVSQFHAFIVRMLYRALMDILQSRPRSDVAHLLESNPQLIGSCKAAEMNMPWRLTAFRSKLAVAAKQFLSESGTIRFSVDQVQTDISELETMYPISNVDETLTHPRVSEILMGYWVEEAGVRVNVAFPKEKVAFMGVHAGQCTPANTVSDTMLETAAKRSRHERPETTTVYDLRRSVAAARDTAPSFELERLGQSARDNSGKLVKITSPRNAQGVTFPMDALPRVNWSVRALRQAGWRVIVELAVLHNSPPQRIKRIQSALSRR
eukprot:gb/GECG01007331.1/.p1 GENE.gb/GECG01007331.1/~~gb/GECG01007331.1/.p1  ORF type:complete len:837 (+),score=91.13 gb/GECG01007331.1/:1-2511(+)